MMTYDDIKPGMLFMPTFSHLSHLSQYTFLYLCLAAKPKVNFWSGTKDPLDVTIYWLINNNGRLLTSLIIDNQFRKSPYFAGYKDQLLKDIYVA